MTLLRPDMTEMRLPNLLIPGTQKGGTTTIHRILSAHPNVFMSGNKEPGLFHNRAVVTPEELAEYAAHFERAPRKARYVGEATAHYFWEKDPDSPWCGRGWRALSCTPLIRETLTEDLSVIVTLRHPVERAVSGYHHNFTRGRIEPGEGILEAGKRAKMGIVDLGFYRRHYEGWRAGLPGARFFLTTTDELRESAADVYARLIEWLGLPPVEVPEEVLGKRWNSKSNMRARTGTEAEFPEVTPDEMAALREIYAEEIAYWSETLPGARGWTARG